MQDGWYQCPGCDGPMTQFEFDNFGVCSNCVDMYDAIDEQLEIERMAGEGGPVAGEVAEGDEQR